MAILYRKYRPQTFEHLVGQNHIKVTLENEISRGNVAHAYLFTGPRGVGKTTMARLFAKALNCQARKDTESEPCDQCDACVAITKNRDLDVIEIDAASHTGVDNVRENIIEQSRFTPHQRKYKVFIIDEVHMLSLAAFNALLKVLEEPPAYVVFILATTEIHKVPATIISRCQRFDFKKISIADLIKRMQWICDQENKEITNEALRRIAQASEGCLRDAESLLSQVLSIGEDKIDIETVELILPPSNYILVDKLIEKLILKNSQESIEIINQMVEDGVDLEQFTIDLIEFLRKILLNKYNYELNQYSPGLEESLENKIIEYSQKFSIQDLVGLINILIEKRKGFKDTLIYQLPLELAISQYCLSSDSIAIDQEKKLGGRVATPIKNNFEQKSGSIDLNEIKLKWNKVLETAQEKYPKLFYIFKIAFIQAVEGNKIILGLPYNLHVQKLSEKAIITSAEEILCDVYGCKLKLEPILLETPTTTPSGGEQTSPADEVVDLDGLVKKFGGKIIE